MGILESILSIFGLTEKLINFINQEPKKEIVNSKFIEKSGILERWRADGFEVHYTRLDKIKERELDGWQVLVEKKGRFKSEVYYDENGNTWMVKKN